VSAPATQCGALSHHGPHQYDRLVGHRCTRRAAVNVIVPTGEVCPRCRQHAKILVEQWHDDPRVRVEPIR